MQKPGVGLDDPCGLLPTPNVLLFSDYFLAHATSVA